MRHLLRAAVLTASVVAAGCSADPGPSAPITSATSATPAAPSESAGLAGSAGVGAAASPTVAPSVQAALTQPWATATLTDVRTGESFRIADFVAEGRVVFLETMAIWCSKCRSEQQAATTAFEQLDRARVTWIAIDVEASEDAATLARYSQQNGFDFTYAIADPDLARALVAEFGDQILNPPSVNVVVISPDGRVTPSRGHLTADELVALAREHGA